MDIYTHKIHKNFDKPIIMIISLSLNYVTMKTVNLISCNNSWMSRLVWYVLHLNAKIKGQFESEFITQEKLFDKITFGSHIFSWYIVLIYCGFTYVGWYQFSFLEEKKCYFEWFYCLFLSKKLKKIVLVS